jgi:Outer membrane protein beta-barrel domain
MVAGRVFVLWMGLSFAGAALTPYASAENGRFSLIVRGNYTTGSQLYTNPQSPSEIERAEFFPIQNFLGYGFEVRYQFPDLNVALGLSADYIHTVKSNPIFVSGGRVIPSDDGYQALPLELTGYFLIPVSGPAFGIYMGGGAGVYLGRRTYSIAGTEAETVDRGHGVGIHVLGGLSYRFLEWFSLNAEMKFRDLQFTTSNAFSVSQVVYNNTVIRVSQKPFESRVHTDGIVFQLGAVVSF